MLRLTAVLCVAMFLALLIGGVDRGQLRPGLALARAEGRLSLPPEPEPEAAVQPVAVAAPVLVQPEAVAEPEVVDAAFVPVPAPAPVVRRRVAEPVFTLSGLTAAPLDEPAAEPAAPEALAEGQVFYVTAQSVNVRQGPSKDASVVGKLGRGEAATVMWQEGDDWARIIIEGDGLEGYVATRFLSNAAP